MEGIALGTWVLYFFLGGFWIAYGIVGSHNLEVVMGSLLVWPLQFAIIMRLTPWRHWRTVAGAAALVGTLCVVPGLGGGWAWCVYGTGVAMIAVRVPQLVELIRHRDASGVSAYSWLYGAACSGAWILYYATAHLAAALVATCAAGTANIVIMLLTVWRHRQAVSDARALRL